MSHIYLCMYTTTTCIYIYIYIIYIYIYMYVYKFVHVCMFSIKKVAIIYLLFLNSFDLGTGEGICYEK